MTDKNFEIAPLDYEYLIRSGIRTSSLDSLEIIRANRLKANRVGDEDQMLADAVNKRLSKMVESENASLYFREHFLDGFLHKFPLILFISLPFMAFIMHLLFLRRKDLSFFHHSIFTIHTYIFSFIASLIFVLFAWASSQLNWGIFMLIFGLVLAYALLYPLIAIKKFYNVSWLKAFVTWSLMYLLGSIVFGIIALLFAVIQFFLL